MEKFSRLAASVGLLLIAAGLFTLSYVVYIQEDRGRWLPVLHEPSATAVVDSYTGRVWHIEHDGEAVSIVKVFDATEREIKMFPGKK